MSLLAGLALALLACFPRVSGDEPGETVRTLVWGEFSPREWG